LTNYSLSSGSQQAVTSFVAGPQGGTYKGTATLSCTSGSMTPVGSPECDYVVSNPMVTNQTFVSPQPPVHLAADVFDSYCATALPGSTPVPINNANPGSGLSTAVNLGSSTDWTCWGPSGFTCIIPSATGCSAQNGCACNAFVAQGSGGGTPGTCWVTSQLTCQRFGP
jgi:hypothetical protein